MKARELTTVTLQRDHTLAPHVEPVAEMDEEVEGRASVMPGDLLSIPPQPVVPSSEPPPPDEPEGGGEPELE